MLESKTVAVADWSVVEIVGVVVAVADWYVVEIVGAVVAVDAADAVAAAGRTGALLAIIFAYSACTVAAAQMLDVAMVR